MKNKILNILNEDFFKFVPEFMIDDVIEKHCKKWQQNLKDSDINKLAEALVEELKGLYLRYLKSGTFKDPRKMQDVIKNMRRVLTVTQEDLIEAFKIRSKQQSDITNDIKQIVRVRIAELLRLI